MYSCINEKEDCQKVKIQFDSCYICEKVWEKTIEIAIYEQNPHTPSIYKKAEEKFIEIYEARFSDMNYSFNIQLISKIFVHYDFGQSNYWEFEFKVFKR